MLTLLLGSRKEEIRRISQCKLMGPILQVEHSLGYVVVSASCSEMQSKAYLTVEQYFQKL